MISEKLTYSSIALALALGLTACSSSSDTPVKDDDLQDSTDEQSDTSQMQNAESNSDTEQTTTAESNTDTNTNTNTEQDTNTAADTDTDTTTNNPTLKFGSITVDVSSTSTYITGAFIDMNQSIAQSDIDVALDISEDRCEVELADETLLISDEPPIDIDTELFKYISAGEVLTLSSPAGTYAELQRNIESEVIYYAVPGDREISGDLPSQLTVSIPGDEFPSFTDVSIPEVQLLQVLNADSLSTFNRDTTTEWVASGESNSLIYFNVTLDEKFVTCRLLDDGNFTLPDNIKAIFPADAQGYANIHREKTTNIQRDNVLLSVTKSVLAF